MTGKKKGTKGIEQVELSDFSAFYSPLFFSLFFRGRWLIFWGGGGKDEVKIIWPVHYNNVTSLFLHAAIIVQKEQTVTQYVSTCKETVQQSKFTALQNSTFLL